MTRRARLASSAAVLTLGVVAVIVGWAAPASAHATLVSTEPQAQAVLDQSPARVAVGFNEAVGIPPEALRLFDHDGKQVGIGKPAHGDLGAASITSSLPSLTNGVYVVAWRAISADSHPVEGAFTFQVGTATPAQPPSDLLAQILRANGTDSAAGLAGGFARWAALASLALLIGVVAFPLVTGLDSHNARWRSLRRWAALAAAAAGGAALAFQVPVSAGQSLSTIGDPDAWSSLLETTAGRAALVRAVLLVAVAVLVWASRRPSRLADRAVVGLTAAAVVASAMSGHGSAGRLVALGALSTTLHTGAMGVWLGGLVVLAVVVLRTTEHPGDDAVGRFSTTAFACVVTLVITGVGQAWRQLDSFAALGDTTYGRLLIVKTILVGVMVAVGGLSRRVVHRQLAVRAAGAAPGSEPAHQLRSRVLVEIGVGATVLAVTAALMATNPAQAASTGIVSRTMVNGDIIVSLSVDPARVGPNEIHLYLSGPGGSLQVFTEVTLTAAKPDRDIQALNLALTPAGPNHYIAESAQFPFRGRWQLTVSLLVSEFDRRTLTTTIPIS